MEKIYMEESKKQRKSVMNASVALSFVVSIFAVFSLAMFGIVMNQGTGISYAAPNPDVDTSFTLDFGNSFDVVSTTGKIYGFQEYYYKDIHNVANQVFCIERNNDVEEGPYSLIETARSTEADVSKDYGLMYLLNVGQTESLRKEIHSNYRLSSYVVQSAIWKYLAGQYSAVDAFKLHQSGDYDDAAVLNGTIQSFRINGTEYTGDVSQLHAQVNTLVAEARKAGAPKVFVTRADDEISKTEDGKYYQSSLITVSTTPTTISGYTITLSGIDGAIAVDEDGNEITGVVAPGKKFYVRIPAEKATEEVQKVQVNVTANFDAAEVVYYKRTDDDTAQRLATLKPGTESGGVEVEFVTTGNTGMNTAQTIYFIGLIVLLCGVGIVYANVKPVEAKQ